MNLSIHCLRSLVEFSIDPVTLVLHEDGTLTEEDREQISAALNTPTILSRVEADAIMAERLRGYPAASEFRRNSVWGLKLLDIVLFEDDTCFYCDGDVRFFRPFRGLFTADVCRGKSVFLGDVVWEAYSVRPWHLMDSRKLKVMSGINTGLTVIDRNLYDLDFVEWFLSQPDYRSIPAWIEPTCWAAMAMRANGHLINPEQLVNLYANARLTSKAIGGHFLSSYRNRWQNELYRWMPDFEGVSEIEIKPGISCSALRLGLAHIKRKIQNTVALSTAKNQ